MKSKSTLTLKNNMKTLNTLHSNQLRARALATVAASVVASCTASAAIIKTQAFSVQMPGISLSYTHTDPSQPQGSSMSAIRQVPIPRFDPDLGPLLR